MIDNRPPDDPHWFIVCPPCEWGVHDACLGGVTFCMCFTEVLIEAEEADGE